VARLRDIQDLFLGIGLGRTLTQYRQGRIGQILSSKQPTARAIIEKPRRGSRNQDKRRLSRSPSWNPPKINLSTASTTSTSKWKNSWHRSNGKPPRRGDTREIREQMRGLLRQVLASKAKELDLEASAFREYWAKFPSTNLRKRESVAHWETEQERPRSAHLRT